MKWPEPALLATLEAFAGDAEAAFDLLARIWRDSIAPSPCALVVCRAGRPPRLLALADARGVQSELATQPAAEDAGRPLAIAEHAFAGSEVSVLTLAESDPAHPVLGSALLSIPLHLSGEARWCLVSALPPDGMAMAAHALLVLNACAPYLRRAWLRDEASGTIRDLADVQRSLLPLDPEIRGLQWAAHYQPSAEAGGDYYDLMALSHRVAPGRTGEEADAFGLIVADVSGHGPGAAMEAVQFDAILRTYRGDGGEGPAAALSYANRHFFSRRPRGHFLTACAFLHLPQQRQARICNAGHLPPLRRRRGQIERIEAGRDIPVGILREHIYANGYVDTEAGDLIVVYTDGIIEARDAAGREFGLERLESLLSDPSVATPTELLTAVLAALHAHQGGPVGRDDQTLVVLQLS